MRISTVSNSPNPAFAPALGKRGEGGFLPGYLLMEVVLAMGIAAAVLSGVFMIANGSLSLANTVVTEGRMDARREGFLNFFERNFEALPGNAEVELITRDTGARFIPTLTIQNAPTAFSFAGQTVSAKAIVLTTVPSPSGGVNVVLEYYEEALLDDQDNVAAVRPEPVGSIILYRDIWRFELRALDSRTMEWVSDWDIRGRLPLQFELNAVFDSDGEEIVHFFWIPPKTNPANLMRNLSEQSAERGRRNQGEDNDNEAPEVGQ
ncbi:MAG: hypothetical protein Q7Q71_05395 [Verrucomicrobiota bacterium JB023]|nr:hypothetical protein [Verrucomicrobiota bacterium JB023]